jgi:hypothetical protein
VISSGHHAIAIGYRFLMATTGRFLFVVHFSKEKPLLHSSPISDQGRRNCATIATFLFQINATAALCSPSQCNRAVL